MRESHWIVHGLVAAAAAAVPLRARAQGAAVPQPAQAVIQPAPAGEAPDPKAASYSLGLYFGGQLHASGLSASLAMDELERGLHDGLGGKPASEADKQRMAQWMRNGRVAMAARNRAEAGEFLAANARIAGVKTTASGLQYTVVSEGDPNASSPRPTDTVTVQYRGHLLDGSVFDSSDAHGVPARFSLNGGVIPGWREALLMMKPGAQWRVFLPPDLAYGDVGRPNIPPGSGLVFDVQLVKIEGPRTLERGQGATPAEAPTPAQAAAPARKVPAR
jgi:FKBP-type peptidyl-prolyl cis-trans isomerase